MADIVPYENITEYAEASYDQTGWNATKVWIFDGCDMSDPDSTVTLILQSNFLPSRGDDHPSGEDMQADKISGKAISSNQVQVTVTYKKLSAVEQEPDDAQPALMTIGSSVTSVQVGIDSDGNPLAVHYIPLDGAAPAVTLTNTLTQVALTTGSSGTAVNFAVGDVQFPNTIIRFARREQNPPSAKIDTYMGKCNSAPISWGDFSADPVTLLCTRIEGTTNDGGNSYVVEYEFQYNPDSWNLNAYYTLPNNTMGAAVDTSSGYVIGPGDQPLDTDFETFQVYSLADFNALALFGAS